MSSTPEPEHIRWGMGPWQGNSRKPVAVFCLNCGAMEILPDMPRVFWDVHRAFVRAHANCPAQEADESHEETP